MFPNNFKNRCRWSTHPIDEPFWTEVFVTEGRSQYIRSNNYLGIAKKEIDSTGYSWQELARIERAFESIHRPFNDIDAYNFNGLMAVVDVLAEIHGISLEETAAAKSLFVK